MAFKPSTCKTDIVIVSNEVGSGIVPDNKLARQFQDAAGFMNQKVASVSDEVYFVVAGIETRIK